MNKNLQKIWVTAILAICAITSNAYGTDAYTQQLASKNTPLANHVTAQQLWARIKQLIALGRGYLTREDIEHALGYKLPIFNPTHADYEAKNSVTKNTNYSVDISVTSHALSDTYHGRQSQVNFTLPQESCLNLLELRQELAKAGFKRNGTFNLKPVGPLPPPPMEIYGSLSSKIGWVTVLLKIKNTNNNYKETSVINDTEASNICISDFRIDGRP